MLPCYGGGSSLACIEVGSEKCPCFLAMIKSCPVCTYLSGEGSCDCQWTGVCVLLESEWAFNAKGNYNTKKFIGRVDEVRYLGPNIFHVRLSFLVPVISEPCKLGAFFVIANPNLPVSLAPPFVCNIADGGKILELIAPFSFPKESGLLLLRGQQLELLGPFSSAIIGEKALRDLSGGTALLIGEGFYQGAMVLAAKALLTNGNKVKSIIVSGRARRPYILDFLEREEADIYWAGYSRKDGLSMMEELLVSEEIDLVFCFGTFLHHVKVISVLKKQWEKRITPVFLSPLI